MGCQSRAELRKCATQICVKAVLGFRFQVSGLRGLFVSLKQYFKIDNRPRKPETLKAETV